MKTAKKHSVRPSAHPPRKPWQTAIALQDGAVLVTTDRHFAVIPGLKTED